MSGAQKQGTKQADTEKGKARPEKRNRNSKQSKGKKKGKEDKHMASRNQDSSSRAPAACTSCQRKQQDKEHITAESRGKRPPACTADEGERGEGRAAQARTTSRKVRNDTRVTKAMDSKGRAREQQNREEEHQQTGTGTGCERLAARGDAESAN
ncbi:hypothetical protein, conserved in T. vivax [Trypanosoma vivax Y486]|uniref:Uncharacterized protein n=1 Tax=Trypanosoma vivax (strain Y486) TaxID=1055687 RepID=F9WVC0_TRYVY|nr:hypothetical protein, conserved in T. vivax [Trypanosoma vivax Y486]|eukprot:CCD21527.1 hypothetical protein, conserved in T. vivax [Trypanosoma vivax Y486]